MSKNAKRQWAKIKERLTSEAQAVAPCWLYDEPELGTSIPVAYLHELDSTEGLECNCPHQILSFSPESPFGIPGVDHSVTYPVTTTPLFRAEQ